VRAHQRLRPVSRGRDGGGPIAQPEGEVLLAVDHPSKLNTRAVVAYPSANRRGTGTWVRIVAVGSGNGIDPLGQPV